MSIRKLSVTFCWLGVGLLAILGPAVMISRAQDVPPPLPVDPNAVPPAYANPPAAEQNDPNAEVMTRGPIHEAYAVPLSAGQTAGMIVPRQPPAQIDEVPPDMKPEGGNSVWIPGYWSWDDDRHDFLWVSGVWRSAARATSLDARLLAGRAGAGIPMDFRLLDAIAPRRSDLSAPAASNP